MEDFQTKSEYNIDDIQALINNEVEESVHLDYKEAGALEKSDGKKKEISKDISAFANSDGGIIVYGLKEKDHKPVAISYIDGGVFTKEWLEQTINSTIQRRIPDVKIFPLRKDGNVNESVYIVKIPKSLDAPHICKDKRYYKRFNFESVQMEEYEVRELYGRKVKSKMFVSSCSFGQISEDDVPEDKIRFRFEVNIGNDGDIPEAFYKVNVYFRNLIPPAMIFWDKSLGYIDYTVLDGGRIKISAHSHGIVYPNEMVCVLRFHIEFPISNFRTIIRDAETEISLFYNSEEDKMPVVLHELLNKIDSKQIGK